MTHARHVTHDVSNHHVDMSSYCYGKKGGREKERDDHTHRTPPPPTHATENQLATYLIKYLGKLDQRKHSSLVNSNSQSDKVGNGEKGTNVFNAM